MKHTNRSPRLAERLAEPRHIGHAALVEHHRLAVQHQLLHRQRGSCAGDRGEPVGPVVAVAGEDAGAAAGHVSLHAVAVVLDLMQPLGAGGCVGPQGRDGWGDVAREKRPVVRLQAGRSAKLTACLTTQAYARHALHGLEPWAAPALAHGLINQWSFGRRQYATA